MKLLYISEDIAVSETFIKELSKGLLKNFSITHVVSKQPFYNEGIDTTVISYNVVPKVAYWLHYLFENRGKKILYQYQKQKATKKLDSYFRTTDVIYVDYGTTAVKFLPLVKRYSKPLVVHFHGFDITRQLSSSWYGNDLKELFKFGSYFITASHHVRRLLVLQGCPSDNIKVIRYGINIPPNILENTLRYQEKENDFIFIGRLTHKKNPIALIYAFKRLHDFNSNLQLKLIGSGPLMEDCKALINTLNLQENITLYGALPHFEALELLRNSKIYVQHSVTSNSGDQEGFAISLAEAAMLEMPVVSTLHNGIPENVINGETGYLVREFDYESMADKMLELINDPVLAEEMGKKGKKHISNLCSTEKRVYQISELIKKSVEEYE